VAALRHQEGKEREEVALVPCVTCLAVPARRRWEGVALVLCVTCLAVLARKVEPGGVRDLRYVVYDVSAKPWGWGTRNRKKAQK